MSIEMMLLGVLIWVLTVYLVNWAVPLFSCQKIKLPFWVVDTMSMSPSLSMSLGWTVCMLSIPVSIISGLIMSGVTLINGSWFLSIFQVKVAVVDAL